MPSEDRERAGRRSKRAWLIALTALALIAALLVAGAILSGVGRRERALARIRERGEPVRPSELASGSLSAGGDALEWMRGVDALLEEEDPERIASEACPERLEQLGEAYELVEQLEGAVWDAARADDLDACERAFLERSLADRSEALASAAGVAQHGRLELAPLLDAKPVLSGVADLPLGGAIHASQLLGADAVLAATEGDTARAIARLGELFDAADTLAELPFVLAWDARVWCLNRAASATVRVATILPDRSDLGAIDVRLAEIDPAAELRRAFAGDRALGIDVYEELRGEAEVDLPLGQVGTLRRAAFRLLLAHDEADYLEQMERAIEACERRPPPAEATAWKPRFYSCVSAMLLIRWEERARRSATLEARLALARAVLLARRAGAHEAIEWTRAQRDPLDGKPLRARLDDAGVLWLWSVGEDGVDQGGATFDPADPQLPWDLVARTRPAAER